MLVGFAAAQGVITTVAGGSFADNLPATQVRLDDVQSLALDAQGNAFFGDGSRIRRVDHGSGIITTVAGYPGGSAEEGPADQVSISPQAIAFDPQGNLLFLTKNCLKKLDLATHTISRIAGLSSCNATAGPLGTASDVAVDAAGGVYVLDQSGVVRKVKTADGTISVVAGQAQPGGSSADGVPATATVLSGPSGIALDVNGNLYIMENPTGHLRRVDAATGIITTIAGAGTGISAGDGGPAQAATFQNPFRIHVDRQNNIYIGEQARIRKIDSGTGTIRTVAGTGQLDFNGEGLLAFQTNIGNPAAMLVDPAGALWFADSGNRRIRMVSGVTGLVRTVAGVAPNGDGGLALGATLTLVSGLAIDRSGDLYIGDAAGIRRVDHATGFISTFAAGGPVGRMIFDDAGDLLFSSGNQVKRIRAGSRSVDTIAGDGLRGFGGDGGPATSAQLWSPSGIATDQGGNIFIADSGNNRIRRVDAHSGIITTLVGGETGFEDVLGFQSPRDIVIAKNGEMHIGNSHRVFKLDTSGTISIEAGNGILACEGDGGPANVASVGAGVVLFDAVANTYVADTETGNPVCGVRRIEAGTGIIQTVAGGGSQGVSEGAPALSVTLLPRAVAFRDDTLYIAEATRVLKVTPVTAPPLPAPPHDFVIRDAPTLQLYPISPGEVAAVTGNYLGPAIPAVEATGPDGLVPKQVGGVEVFFNDLPAPLLYVSAGRIYTVVPFGLTTPVTVKVRTPTGELSLPQTRVVQAAPMIFPAGVLNSDGTLNTEETPAPKKSILTAFGTGFGRLNPSVPDGTVMRAGDLAHQQFNYSASVADFGTTPLPAQLSYIGPAPGMVAGVTEAILTLPDGIAGGQAALFLATPPIASLGKTIFIRKGDVTPTVTSMVPPVPPTWDPSVTVHGKDFDQGLTAELFYNGELVPDGVMVSHVTGTSFFAQLNINGKTGQLGIEVIDPGGKRSERFYFTVQP